MPEVMEEPQPGSSKDLVKKKPKKGIIYLSQIPSHMNVLLIREYFQQFGKLGRVYLVLDNKDSKTGEIKWKHMKGSRKYKEGWIEFDKKSVAKRVATLLNNTQVDNRKKSKHYDQIWSMKYLSHFKWNHLHERLMYENQFRKQKLRNEIQSAKHKTNFFTQNLDLKKKKKLDLINKEYQDKELFAVKSQEEPEVDPEERKDFFKTLFN